MIARPLRSAFARGWTLPLRLSDGARSVSLDAVLAEASAPMLSLAQEPLVLAHQEATEMEVAELFDKYNLQTLPVIDERNKLTGVITSDDVISMLRSKL